MVDKKVADYDADALITLDPMVHIQKRPSLTLGPYERMQLVALREPIDNSVDEFRAGHGKIIRITLDTDGSAQIEDSGRGVPTGINSRTGENGIYMAFGKVGSGGKFGAAGSGYSGGASLGLNGVGTTATNATSSRFDTIVYRGGKQFRLSFQNGKPGHFADDSGPDAKFTPSMDIVESKDPRTAAQKKERPSGTTIKFWPNKAIFGDESTFRVDELRDSLRSTAFLVPGIRIIIDDKLGEPEREGRPAIAPQVDDFEFDGGIAEMIDVIANDEKLHDTIHLITKGSFKETVPVPQEDGTVKPEEVERIVEIDVALRWGTGYDSITKSFVNTISTPLGGTHVTGMERSLSKVFLDSIKSTRGLLKAKEESPILEDIKEGLTAIISINQSEPSFVGQEKQRLGGTNTQRVVQQELLKSLSAWVNDKKNAAALKIIMTKIVNASRTRLAQRAVKDTARKKNALEASTSMPAKLVSCASGDARYTELQICEGDSALGGLKGARSSEYQAIYPLKGKPLNTYGVTLGKILENQEWADLIQIIGAGVGRSFELDKMNYKRIVMLADADADGSHIRVLLVAFFWKYMRELIEDGRLYTALPPLFSVTTTGKNKEKYYALNQEELDKILKKLDSQNKKYERIARHKGLGEYSEEVLASEVMDPRTRTLRRITASEGEEAQRIMDLAMGDNASGRRDWIIESRDIIDDEEIDA